jgi:Family of unknown function (DUF6221)
VSDLVAFWRARLDEDEAEARETADADAEFWSDVKGDGTYFDRFGPARVLREVEAHRAILAAAVAADGYAHRMAGDSVGVGAAAAWDQVIRHLVAVYRDHPDYDGAWKP